MTTPTSTGGDAPDLLLAFGNAIKALDEHGRVGGYLVCWGSDAEKDLQGEYFTPDTDLALDVGDTLRGYYHHALDGTLKATPTGKITVKRIDDVGVWVEEQLNLRSRWVQAVWKLIQRGVLGWSSGALPQTVEVDPDGRIKTWHVVEGSKTPSPAEPRATQVVSLKSYLATLDDATLERLSLSEEAPVPASQPAAAPPAPDAPDVSEPNGHQTLETQPMNDELLHEAAETAVQTAAETLGVTLADDTQTDTVAAAKDALADLTDQTDGDDEESRVMKAVTSPDFAETVGKLVRAAVKPVRQQAVASALKANLATLTAPQSRVEDYQPVGGERRHRNPRAEIRAKYADVSAADMAYMTDLLTAINRHRGAQYQPAPEFVREMAGKAADLIEDRKLSLSPKAAKAVDIAAKANELSHSTQSSYGDEWVAELWSSDIWRSDRLDNVVARNTRFIDMPSDPYKLPIEGSDPTVYAVPETTNEDQLLLDGAGNPIPDSKIGSSNATLNAAKLALRVGFSSELVEDSIIPVVSMYREQAVRVMQNAIDYVLLNADDTNSSANINTTGSPSATDKYLYGGGDGFLHLPLVDNTALAVNNSGAGITLAKIRETRFKMSGAKAMDISNLVMYTDVSTYGKMLSLDEINVYMNRGAAPTVQTGEVGRIDNIPVYVSNELSLAQSDGTVHATAGSNTLGRMLFVHRPSWIAGYRRQVRLMVDYLPYYDAYQMVATMRMALVRKDTSSASLLYNIAV